MSDTDKWELARNLMDAKKALDSLWFIAKNIREFTKGRDLCNEKRSTYYINV